jgi:serine/threonine-protein kinase
MTKCPECGEQSAENDIFCSYCGISLRPVFDVEPDPSTTETIVGTNFGFIGENESEKPIVVPNDSNSAPQIATPQVSEVSKESDLEAVEIINESENRVAGKTAENWSMNTESVELSADLLNQPSDSENNNEISLEPRSIPSAENIAEFESEDEKLDKSSEIPVEIDEIPVPQVLQELETENRLNPEKTVGDSESVDETPISETAFESISEEIQKASEQSGADFSEEKKSEPTFSAESQEQSMRSANLTESVSTEEQKSVDEGLPKVSLGEFSQKNEEVENEGDTDWNTDDIPSVQSDEISSAIAESDSTSIEKPAEPFESESQDDQALFDSVQIIQNKEVQEEQSEEKSSETPSPTQQNFGIGDTDGRKAAKLQPLDEGTILNNRYEIVRKIGGGGMGAVYLANDRNLGGILRAVKEMVQSYIETEQHDKAISDFQREAMILSNLDHPAIPTIYDYFFDEPEGRFYLVMRYISGGDLSGRLRSAPEGRIDEKSVTEWAIQIADVLDYLHKQDPIIVYRDLKPSNIMIDGNSGRVMLIDFGIARSINKEEKGVTAVGTMGYAPPELFSGNVDPRSDIYSLGSTMFHLLTGADPQSNPLLIFDFQKNPRPRQINSQLSDQIEKIVMKAVEYNSEMRFSSAGELCEALKEHLENLQVGKISYGVNAAPSAVGFAEQPVFCGFCGKQIVASDVFCAFCGSQQPIAQQSFQASSAAVGFTASAGTAKLFLMTTGELEPSSFLLEKPENLIGRRDPMSNIFPEVDLSKYDPQTKISRRHARIWREGSNFMVEDLGSSNGTTLLSSMSEPFRLLPNVPRLLANGDKLKVGDTTLHFTAG